MTVNAILRHRRDTAANWTSTNPILEDGQLGFETNTLKSKLGNGVTAWNALAYTATSSTTTLLAGFPVSTTGLATGDHLEFLSTNWVNVQKTTLSDGGNF